MSCDKLVFDLSQEIEGSPNVFVRKDWLNILDNQNQNYQSNQSIVDTSQLSNSNKWMSYREGYLMIPMVLSMSQTAASVNWLPVSNLQPYCMGLKNWFGSIIHSFTLDYNGTTVIQQTPFCNMWNSFKLLTTMSWGDVISQGATIGFYPDDPTGWVFVNTAANTSNHGSGTCNSIERPYVTPVDGYIGATMLSSNTGYVKRTSYINYSELFNGIGSNTLTNVSLQTNITAGALWKSYVYKSVDGTVAALGMQQMAITGIVYLKHIHSFFNMIPLLKGVFMKMTLNLNNASTTFTTAIGPLYGSAAMITSVPVGGVNPIMLPSAVAGSGGAGLGVGTYVIDLSVGGKALSQAIKAIGNAGLIPSSISQSVYLYVPAYTFNPVFEQAYLSSGVKQIKYTDIYQYQVLGVGAGNQFNNLVTNGIANIKSVLIIPFFSTSDVAGNAAGTNTGLGVAGMQVFQSPFDPAGTGCTSPLCHFANFNVQISGQNAIYNTQRYTFEQFNNQLYGQNAVNGGLVDGLTSGLIDYNGFQSSQCYYYINVERMLPVEQSVPKSVQIMGQNMSAKIVDLWVFVEYGVEINIDPITGARV